MAAVCGVLDPKGGNRQPPKPRKPSRRTSLPFSQAKNVINGLRYAETLAPEDTPWLHITIAMEQSDDFKPDARSYLKLQGRILKAIKRWLRQRALPEHFLWVREAASYGQHSHILIRFPPEHRLALADLIRHVGKLHDTPNNRAVVIRPEWDRQTDKPDTRGMHSPAQRCGVMLDLIKTMAPRAQHDGKPLMPAIGVRHRAPCVIHGKRSGVSSSLDRSARAAAGWQEFHTPAELHAALGGIIAAAKQAHNRRRKLRKRVRRGATTVPPLRPQAPAYAPADDLAADFFD